MVAAGNAPLWFAGASALCGAAPTFVKMDIEGAELDALQGARETITRHAPVLAICLYHRPDHLWEVPLYLKGLRPDYRLYLRRYGEDCWEQVLYAVPADRAVFAEGAGAAGAG